GMSYAYQDMKDFQEYINEIEMEDLCSNGLQFTWTKSLKNPNDTILNKLDRVMCNSKFLSNYNNAFANFLPYGISDHSPTIFNCPSIGYAMFQLLHKLKSLKPQLNKLNWKNENMFNRVEELKGRLFDVQARIDKDPLNKELREEEVKFLDEYTSADQDEEKLLRQKAKVEWLRDGDRDFAYFHKILKERLNKSKIHTVMGTDGSIHENDQVGIHFVNHFENFLGSTSIAASMEESDVPLFSKIDDSDAVDMCKDVNEEEIKRALFDIDDSKAPRLGGFTAKFFKKAWGIIKDDFCNAVKEFFKTGRAIIDNILLTQELLRGYNNKNGPKRCSLKIDIQKACDTMSWSFLEQILHNYGFPITMIKWIMVCISTPKFTICVNGERVGYFKGGKDLRQGDPISPYLFTLVIEVLNLFLKDEIAKEKEFKYHFGCKKLKITHLCFVDDLLMLDHGDSTSITTIKKALEKFSKVSSLHPNMSKSTMFYGSLSEDEKNAFLTILPFKIGKMPVRYLGVPLMDKKIGVKDCKSLVDEVRQKLNDWKNKSLTRAGRSQLIASVWNDNQALIKVIRKREVCLVGFNDQSKLYDIIDGNKWKWPDDWLSKYELLQRSHVPKLKDIQDKAFWVTNQENMVQFSTNQVWKDIRSDGEKVKWDKLVKRIENNAKMGTYGFVSIKSA
ncbi:RNA-directed DNA polymerase, eukaryota, reverse transcriptase zinc-binding domain protein, partial [Tanacetum coccineum]